MEYRILGPLEVLDDAGRAVSLPGPGATLLLRLLVAQDEPVALDELADALWPQGWPERAADQLHAHLANLHRLVDPGSRRGRLVVAPPGYALITGGDSRDDSELEDLVTAAESALDRGQVDDALQHATAAVGLARGPVLAEAAGHPWAEEPARRLQALLASAARIRVAAGVALGRAAEVGPDLERTLEADPGHQATWVALAGAHALAGNRLAALATVRRARLQLARIGGPPPGPVLLALEAAVHADNRDRIRHLTLSPATALPNAADPGSGQEEPEPSRPSTGASAARPHGPRRRLQLLPVDTRRLVALLAVAGGEADLPLLARAAGSPPGTVAAALQPAVAAGLVDRGTPAEVARLAGPEVVDGVLADLTPFRRQQLHLLVAQASASLPGRPAGERDHHLRSAGDLAPRR